MSTAINLTLSEFQDILHYVTLPEETRLTITFEDDTGIEIIKRKKAIDAMKKLKGSGNGNLINVLLKERQKDKFK